jgi:hypothetical protein
MTAGSLPSTNKRLLPTKRGGPGGGGTPSSAVSQCEGLTNAGRGGRARRSGLLLESCFSPAHRQKTVQVAQPFREMQKLLYGALLGAKRARSTFLEA